MLDLSQPYDYIITSIQNICSLQSNLRIPSGRLIGFRFLSNHSRNLLYNLMGGSNLLPTSSYNCKSLGQDTINSPWFYTGSQWLEQKMFIINIINQLARFDEQLRLKTKLLSHHCNSRGVMSSSLLLTS